MSHADWVRRAGTRAGWKAARLLGPVTFGAASFFYEAGIADAGAVFQGEVNAAVRVNFGATFSA